MDVFDSIAKVVVPVLLVAVGGLVTWVWQLWKDHHEHKLHVAINYVSNQALKEVRREIRFLRIVTLQIGKAMHIPVVDLEDRDND